MDHQRLVYKIDVSVQSSPSSSLVLTQYKVLFIDLLQGLWVITDQVGGQKKEEMKIIEIEGVEKWEVERILNKQKVRGVVKYLVQ